MNGTDPEVQAGAPGDIVATAEKRDSSIQKTPIAITAIDQAGLNERGVTDVNVLQQFVPNVNFTPVTNFTSGVIVTLRGVGTDARTTGSDRGVAVHMDGVYLGNELVEAGIVGSPYLGSLINPRTYGVELGFRFQ